MNTSLTTNTPIHQDRRDLLTIQGNKSHLWVKPFCCSTSTGRQLKSRPTHQASSKSADEQHTAARSQQPGQIKEGTAQSPEQRLHLGQGNKEECSFVTGSYLKHKTRSEGHESSLHYESLCRDTHKRSKTWSRFEGWKTILKRRALRVQVNLNQFFTVTCTHPMYLHLLKMSYIDPNQTSRLEKFYPVSHL